MMKEELQKKFEELRDAVAKLDTEMLKNVEINKAEMVTALEMALAFILPIWGGMYLIAKLMG